MSTNHPTLNAERNVQSTWDSLRGLVGHANASEKAYLAARDAYIAAADDLATYGPRYDQHVRDLEAADAAHLVTQAHYRRPITPDVLKPAKGGN